MGRYIEDYLKNQLVDFSVVPQKFQLPLVNFIKWRESQNLEFVSLEKTVHSKTLKFAGTVDAVAIEKVQTDKGEILRRVMFDWKTSNTIYDINALQLSAYAKAWEEMYGEKIDVACVVRINKEKEGVQVKMVRDIEHSFHTFRAALFLHNSLTQSHFIKKDRKASKKEEEYTEEMEEKE